MPPIPGRRTGFEFGARGRHLRPRAGLNLLDRVVGIGDIKLVLAAARMRLTIVFDPAIRRTEPRRSPLREVLLTAEITVPNHGINLHLRKSRIIWRCSS
jgi:hypothetical protein